MFGNKYMVFQWMNKFSEKLHIDIIKQSNFKNLIKDLL